MTGVQEKSELRQRLKKLRSGLTGEQVAACSAQTARHILACDAFRKAHCIMGYLAFGKELSVDAVLQQALAEGRQVAVPLIVSPTEFVAAELTSMTDFEYDRYGIRTVRQPIKQLDPAELDLVLVPGVAFGRDGSRMGMGAGYYDRFLPKASQAVLMGVAYDCLLQESLPHDCYDVFVQLLASESGITPVKPL